MLDVYQKRYIGHQKRKKDLISGVADELKRTTFHSRKDFDVFWSVLKKRRSRRIFNNQKIEDQKIELLKEAASLAPSSCNRKAIFVLKTGKGEQLADLLVGGSGWIDRADVIFLIFADMEAYKSPDEVEFMPYLDAGVIVENLYLTAEALNMGVCFCNPNIRDHNRDLFNEEFNPDNFRFCGAMAFGYN